MAEEGIHEAARKGTLADLSSCLVEGADLEARNEWGETPLLIAAKGAHIAAVRLLLNAGADVNAADEAGITSLMAAANSTIRIAQQDGGIYDPWTELIDENVETQAMVEELLDAGTDPDGRDAIGRTALMYAARGLNERVVGMLLARGADPGIEDLEGSTAGKFAEDTVAEDWQWYQEETGQIEKAARRLADVLKKPG